jgi:hypothetical protein
VRAALGALGAAVVGVAAHPAVTAKKRDRVRSQTDNENGICHKEECSWEHKWCGEYCHCVFDLGSETEEGHGRCEPCTCEGKSCGEEDGCGNVCGGCPPKQLCVIGHEDISCKEVPVCAPNGESGICCSGYHKDGICCSADTPGAISILVKVDVFNSITVNTPPNTAIPTVPTPAATTTTTTTNSSQKRRRRRRRRGGRRR